MDGYHHVVVRLRPRDGCREALVEEVLRLARTSLATPGCTGFEVTQGLGPNADLWLLESFVSAAAYEEHVATDHAQRFLTETLPALVAERDALALAPVAP